MFFCLQSLVLLLCLLQLFIKEEIESGDFLGHLCPFLFLASGSVLEDLDRTQEAVDDVDALDEVVGDVPAVHALTDQKVLYTCYHFYLLLRRMLRQFPILRRQLSQMRNFFVFFE